MNFLKLIFLLLVMPGALYAQQQISDADLVRLIKLQDSLRTRRPVEKLYLHTDKNVYAVGDTIWFKGYLFDADYLKYSSRSGLMYVELATDTAVVFRRMVPVGYGISRGQIVIDAKDITEGNYVLRAYTNWQLNFGEDYVFTKNIQIIATNTKPWLVNIKAQSAVNDDKETVNAALAFSELNRQPVRLQKMQLRVNDGKHNLLKGRDETRANGTMDINFNLPAKTLTKNLNIQAESEDENDGRKTNIPVVLNRPENTDLQFMPEGGNLVAGIQTRVAFKAIAEDGLGARVSGKIYNSKHEEVTTFVSMYMGMGSFIITPVANETYTANITLPGGKIKTYPLPQVKKSGTVLNINDSRDSLAVTLKQTEGMGAVTYYLTAQSRGVMCYAQPLSFEGNIKTIMVAKSLFPTGVARFSILNKDAQPLNERIVYIDHHDNLQITIKPNQQNYAARDSIALAIKVTDRAGKPVQGSFSVAVTDNEQAPVDSNANNLITLLLLTSDLKGNVEHPQYYLQNTLQAKQALDNLMLTQGWIGYDWEKIATQKPAFEAEPEFQIKGKVVGLTGKSSGKANVLLAAKNYDWNELEKADDNGRFLFKNIPVTDSADFFLKAANKNAKDMGVGIVIDRKVPPHFLAPVQKYLPWYVDTTLQKTVTNTIGSRLEEEKLTGKNVLKEVEIKEKKIIPASHNLNGPGGADQIITEKEIGKTGVSTLGELLDLKVKGLTVGGFPNQKPLRQAFKISGNEVAFVIDGISLNKMFFESRNNDIPEYYTERYNFMESYLASYPAQDITGIEVMSSTGYTELYNALSNSNKPGENRMKQIKIHSLAEIPYAYIEITTRKGIGPYRRQASGTDDYKPLPFIIAKNFYRPRYLPKSFAVIKDLRSTIHWDPLVITDKDGQATISFYASDRPGNYNIIIEGSDMHGNIGSIAQKLNN